MHDHRHRSPRASRRHAAGLDSSTALRAGAAWPAAGSAHPARPPTHGRSGTQDRSSGGHSVPDRRLPVSPHWTALRAGTVCLFADCSSPLPAVGPRPARIARPFAGRALCARSPGSRLLAGRRHVAGPDRPTVRRAGTVCPIAGLASSSRPSARGRPGIADSLWAGAVHLIAGGPSTRWPSARSRPSPAGPFSGRAQSGPTAGHVSSHRSPTRVGTVPPTALGRASVTPVRRVRVSSLAPRG